VLDPRYEGDRLSERDGVAARRPLGRLTIATVRCHRTRFVFSIDRRHTVIKLEAKESIDPPTSTRLATAPTFIGVGVRSLRV
jgi:hypothetical protein